MITVRKKPTDATKRLIAGKQSYKCANNPNVKLKGIETYLCPLWQKSINDNPGSFDESGFELDHINELSVSGDDSLENFQALCKSCHAVKTKKFQMKKSNNIYHPIYGKFILKQNNHTIYLADSVNIINNSDRWSENRPPDQLRVKEIKEYISKINSVDGILYFANIPNEGLVCYEGEHRRQALKLLEKNYKIFVNIVENPSVDYLRSKFISLNKCVPVTELYLNNNDNHKCTQNQLEIIEAVTNHYCRKWKTHRKTNPNPNRPNFNKEMLKQKIFNIIEDEIKNNITKEKMIYLVDKFNEELLHNIDQTKCTRPMLNKCNISGCYLFLQK